jgi:hypothetical protein
MSQTQKFINLPVSPDTERLYAAANERIAERIGHAPGAEFLMSLMVESITDPQELAETYCRTVFNHMAPATAQS